ncbi:MAG: hypothetical protein FWH07_03485 [Oscillospiraceae bacterium]|nr:hypothetical protein [Oscillospiraceae bacterium]
MELDRLRERMENMGKPPAPVFDSVNDGKPDAAAVSGAAEKIITCPYCFEKFSHSSVWFRMETVFESEEECDPHGLGRTKEDIELLGERVLLEKFEQNKCFLSGESEKYQRFWARFSGGSGEKATTNKEGREIEIPPQKRPVLPVNSPLIKFTKTSEEGLLYSARDVFGVETTRRICPECHNPLPAKFGANPVKLVSVIGITASGKTVYLSQLCRHFSELCSEVGITSTPTSKAAMDFRDSNPIRMGEKLPEGTLAGGLSQPLCFDLSIRKNDKIISKTIVFYDISGENCVDEKQMEKYGCFVKHSSAIILLLDPNQQFGGDYKNSPENVMDAIYNYFQEKTHIKRLPICVTVSKGDMAAGQIIKSNIENTVCLKNQQGQSLPLFNAEDYGTIQRQVKEFIQNHEHRLRTCLNNLFDTYNYFLVSALGTSVKEIADENGQIFMTPAAPPSPKRIEEPLYWLFYRFGYIGCKGTIPPPEDPPPLMQPKTWTCVNDKCLTDKIPLSCRYCPLCRRDSKGNKMPLIERIKEKFRESEV